MTVLVLAACMAATGTSSTAAADPSPLDRARDALAAAQGRLEGAARSLDEIDERIAAAALDLRATEAALDAARGDLSGAVATQLEAAEELASSTAALQSAEEAQAAASSDLTQRIRRRWAQGPAATLEAQWHAVLGAHDLHRVLTARRGIDRGLLVAERERRAAGDARRVAVAARTAPTAVVDGARRLVFTARSDLTVLTRLERRQQAALASLQREQADRREVLADLSADRDALAVLIDRLRLATLGVSIDGALQPPAALPVDGPAPAWAAALPPRGRAWAPTINAYAARNGLDGALLAALVWTESGFDPAAVSHAGAIGLTQLMPGTAAGLRVDPWDPEENLQGGARYLVAQLLRFDRLDLGLAAYNAGPNRVEAAGRQVPDIAETQLYVVRVLERWKTLLAAATSA